MVSPIVLALLFDTVLAVTCGYALARGGRPERIGAAINLFAAGLTVLLRYLGIATGAPAELVVLAIDIAVTAGFYWLAISTTRFWPVWAFGFALANIGTSFAGKLLPQTPLFAYHTGLGLYAYLCLAALVAGTARLPRRAPPAVKHGDRRSCQVSSNEK
jgi:hypothetical protein